MSDGTIDGDDGASDVTSAGPGPWLSTGCSLAVLLAVALSYKRLQPNRGVDWRIHAAVGAAALFSVTVVPDGVSAYVFTQLTVTLVGAVYPIYRSTKAVCTPDEDDDKEWLQFWIVGGVLFLLTTWASDGDDAGVVWLGLLTFAFFWLYFPLTCGALLVYDHVTEPYLSPRLRPLQRRMNNAVEYATSALANAVHLYLVFIVFMFLPAGWKRLLAIAIGTAYPFVCSVNAVATEEIEDDTYWLTYWCVYGCQFLLMNLLEQWLGRIPGFYTLVILSTVYLMLPMFKGADKMFRKILVPLAGLQELLILRDSIQIKKQLLRDLDPERATAVRRSIAGFFAGDDSDADPGVLKGEYMQSWSALDALRKRIPAGATAALDKLQVPAGAAAALDKLKKKMPSGAAATVPTETTNLV